MNKLVVSILFCLTIAVSQAQSVKKWTLEQCVSHAIKNNISVKTSELDVDLANINKRGAEGAFLPTLSASGGHSWNIGLNQNITTGLLQNVTTQFTNVALNSNVVLFNGLQNQNRLRRANLAKISSEFQLEKMQQDVALNVANAYLQILFNKENLKIQQQQLAVNELQLKRSEELVKGGRVPEGDLLNIKATVSSNKQLLIAAENNLYISKLSLAQLLVLDNLAEFDIADTDYEFSASNILLQTPSSIFEKAKTERIEMKLAKSNIDVAEKDIAIAKGGLSPSLSGFYGFNTRSTSLDPRSFMDQFNFYKGHNFGLSLNIPIFNGFTTRNNIDRAKVSLERAKFNEKQAQIDLERTIHTAYSNTQSALKTYEASQETLKARQEAHRYAKERYEVGMSNSFDLSQAQTLLANAEADVIKAKYDYFFRVKILELYFGVKLF